MATGLITSYENEYPEWLPTEMRHTAAPTDRLRSLLPRLLERQDPLLIRLRARKVEHLCLQIDAEACTQAARIPLACEQAHLAIEMALEMLQEPDAALNDRSMIISVVHQVAIAIGEMAPAIARSCQ